MLIPFAAAAILLLTSRRQSAPGSGPTSPVNVPPPGPGGVPGNDGSPARPPPVPGSPSAPGTFPAVGQLWRPRPDLPFVRAQNFAGRAAVQNMAETPGDAPAERDPTVLGWLDRGELDAPTWVRIPVRGGLEVEVMGDVLSRGGVRLCASMIAAQGVADSWDALIMTPGIANAVWSAASLRLPPRPIDPNPGGAKEWLLYYADRVAEVYQSRALALVAERGPLALFGIVADTLGKDYVLDSRVAQQPTQCAIYGWHTGQGASDQTVIQSGGTGASYKHHLAFFDYSHAIRLVRRRAWLNGEAVDLAKIYSERSELVNFTTAAAPCPARHPAIPFRRPGGVLV